MRAGDARYWKKSVEGWPEASMLIRKTAVEKERWRKLTLSGHLIDNRGRRQFGTDNKQAIHESPQSADSECVMGGRGKEEVQEVQNEEM